MDNTTTKKHQKNTQNGRGRGVGGGGGGGQKGGRGGGGGGGGGIIVKIEGKQLRSPEKAKAKKLIIQGASAVHNWRLISRSNRRLFGTGGAWGVGGGGIGRWAGGGGQEQPSRGGGVRAGSLP